MQKNVKTAVIIGSSILGLLGVGFLVNSLINGKGKNIADKLSGKDKDPEGDVVDKSIYKRGDESFVNVRTSPKVDNLSLFDWDDNLIGKVEKNPVGNVVSSIIGDDGYRWYRVDLRVPLDGKSEGYVREDAVEIK